LSAALDKAPVCCSDCLPIARTPPLISNLSPFPFSNLVSFFFEIDVVGKMKIFYTISSITNFMFFINYFMDLSMELSYHINLCIYKVVPLSIGILIWCEKYFNPVQTLYVL
jgi:hypothetical protein